MAKNIRAVALVLCMGFISFVVWNVQSEQRSKLKAYQSQTRMLFVVRNPERTHILPSKDWDWISGQEYQWNWHSYFPEGHRFDLVCGVGNGGPGDTPGRAILKHVESLQIVGTGEKTQLSVAIAPLNSESVSVTFGGLGTNIHGRGVGSRVVKTFSLPRTDLVSEDGVMFQRVTGGGRSKNETTSRGTGIAGRPLGHSPSDSIPLLNGTNNADATKLRLYFWVEPAKQAVDKNQPPETVQDREADHSAN